MSSERQDERRGGQRGRHQEHLRMRAEMQSRRAQIQAHREAIRELRSSMRQRNREFAHRMRDENRSRAEHPHHRSPPKWYHVLFAVSVFFLVFSLCWTAAHYATTFLDKYWPYGHDHPTVRDYVSLLLAMFLFGLLMTVVRLVVKPDKRAVNMFTMMVDAMQRMSKGDFNIKLEAHPRYAGEFTVLVENLNRMASELGQMEQMRQEFISNVSHEIQSPLTAIKGFAQALRQNDMPADARDHYLQIIETESERMSRLSDNLMRLTSLESKQPIRKLAKFRLDRQIRQAVLSCEPIWEAKRLTMEVELDETTLEADEELLSQVWSNLLHNSIKFTPEEGTICVRLREDRGFAEAVIADTGIGVSEADLPHLFERFFKVDKSRNRQSGGSGLGLSIVKKIIDLHGGSIEAGSRIGEGTAFTVRLPLRAVEPLTAAVPDPSPRSSD